MSNLQQLGHVLDALECPQDGTDHIWAAGAEELDLHFTSATQAQRVRDRGCILEGLTFAWRTRRGCMARW